MNQTYILATGVHSGTVLEWARQLPRDHHALVIIGKNQGELSHIASQLTADSSAEVQYMTADYSTHDFLKTGKCQGGTNVWIHVPRFSFLAALCRLFKWSARGMAMGLFALALVVSVLAEDKTGYRASIPAGSLPDPHGNVYSTDGKLSRPVLGIFSVPNLTQGARQEKWADYLADQEETRVPSGVGFYLIEDMEATAFREMARKRMEQVYKTGARPVVLLDEKGAMRKKFGIPEGKTVILLYDKKNHLRYVEEGPATEESVKRLHKVIQKILAE